MDALTRPLERVVEATDHFVRTPSLRLLYVSTTQVLREAVLRHVCAAELLDHNTTPFFVLEGATEKDDDGWTTRAEELRLDWEQLAESAPPGLLPALWAPERASTAFERFGLELGRALGSSRAPMTGLTIVLAPVWITDGERWRRDLAALLRERTFAQARLVVVEADSVETAPLLEGWAGAEQVDARVQEADVAAEAAHRLAGMKSAPPGATGPRVAGAAGPDVTPPRRIKDAAPLTAEQVEAKAQELGVPAAYLRPEVMQHLNVLLATAALAARSGDLAEGVRAQREARDVCRVHGLALEEVVCELVLGGYLLQGGEHGLALERYREARALADARGLSAQAVQAQMAVGACLVVTKRFDDAVKAYAEAGHLGAGSGAKELAIEAYRMCGQLLASKGFDEQAVTAFRLALAQAEEDPSVGATSSAPEAARALAALCRKHRMHEQADALERQAAALEATPPEASAASDATSAPSGEPTSEG